MKDSIRLRVNFSQVNNLGNLSVENSSGRGLEGCLTGKKHPNLRQMGVRELELHVDWPDRPARSAGK